MRNYGGINITITAKNLDKELGELAGLLSALQGRPFMSALIGHGIEVAKMEFHGAVVSHTQSGHTLDHMFEWSNKEGHVDFRGPLWTEFLEDNVSNTRTLRWDYKPARMHNPERAIDEGDSQTKYIFRDRAQIMETGKQVDIKSKSGKMLFIPLTPGMTNITEKDFARGYTFKSEIRTVPGQKVKGSFTQYWYNWYSVEAPKVIREDAERYINLKLREVTTAGGGAAISLSELPVKMTQYQKASESRLIDEANKRQIGMGSK